MSEREATSELPVEGQSADEVRDETSNEVIENISLGDYDPEKGGTPTTEFAGLFDNPLEDGKSEEAAEEQDQEEESGELPVSEDDTEEATDEPEGDSDDSDIEAADDDTDESTEQETENQLFDIDDLKDENIVISMKVDGEVREFTADDIQKIIGQEAVATRKSKTATQELEAAQKLQAEADQRIAAAEAAEAHTAGAEELALMKAQYAALSEQLKEADDYEYKSIDQQRNAIAEAHNAKLAEVNQAKATADAERVKSVRSRLESSERGKKFLTDQSDVENFNSYLSDIGMTGPEWEAAKLSPTLMEVLLEHRELKQSVKPVQRKKKSVSKTLRKTATSSTPASKTSKPKASKPKLTDALSNGSVSLQDISDGKVDFDLEL